MILFIDNVCPKPYEPLTLQTQGLGGSEATMIRITQALSARGHEVMVEQKGRVNTDGLYVAPGTYKGSVEPQAVVVYRNPGDLPEARARFPGSRIYLWCQDLIQPAMGSMVDWMIDQRITLITLSNYHRNQAIQALRLLHNPKPLNVRVMYNPIDNDLKNPGNMQVDYNQLIWLSAPIKGWDRAKTIFEKLYSTHPEFRLHVFNPGYVANNNTDHPGIVYHGPTPNKDLIPHIASSLCVFYPNVDFPETFGIVMAEANAIGTPVVTHGFGAASEVLDHPSEMVDCRNHEEVIKRVLAWQSGERPIVQGKAHFRVKAVVKEWERLLLR